MWYFTFTWVHLCLFVPSTCLSPSDKASLTAASCGRSLCSVKFSQLHFVMIYPCMHDGKTVMHGAAGSILWMFPGLAEQHAKIKQGTCAEPPGGRSRQDTCVQDEYRLPRPCMDSVLKGGGWGGGGKLPAAGREWQCSWAGIWEDEVVFKGIDLMKEWGVIGGGGGWVTSTCKSISSWQLLTAEHELTRCFIKLTLCLFIHHAEKSAPPGISCPIDSHQLVLSSSKIH